MKRRTFISIIALLAGTICVMGQTVKSKLHDVSLIYGLAPLLDRDFLGRDEYKSNGMLSAQYVLNVSERFGIGAIIGYEHFTGIHFDYSANDLMAMILLRATWINKPDFTIYSKAGIGKCWMNDNDNTVSDDSCTAIIIPLPSIGGTFNLGKNFFALIEFSLFSSQGLLLFGPGYRF